MIKSNGLCLDGHFRTTNVRVTREGFWEIEGIAAKVGPLRYEKPDGTVRVEYVTEDVLRDHVETIIGMPVTLGHPPSPVDPDNYQDYSVGTVKDAWYDEDDQVLRVKVMLKDREAQNEVDKGQIELSPGYKAKKEPPTTDSGIDADLVQMARTYNHLAIVEAARGGEEVKLQLDSKGNVIMNLDSEEEKDSEEEEQDEEETEEEDSEEEKQDEEESEEEDEEEGESLDELKEKYDELKEKYDRLKGRADQMEEDTENKDSLDESVPRKMEEWSRVKRVASAAGVDYQDKSISQVKREVVAREAGELNNDSKGYIDGRFDEISKKYPEQNSAQHLSNTFNRDNMDNDNSLDLVDPLDSLKEGTD